MEVAASRAGVLGTRIALPDRERLGAWTLSFALVAYLGLKGGGFEPVVQGQVGIAVWWIALVGAAVGVLPVARFSRVRIAGLGLLALFVIWAAASFAWTESSERTITEVARGATYVGVLVLALSLRRAQLRSAVNGVAAAVALIAVVAFFYRAEPTWFASPAAAEFLPSSLRRLSYPLNYWNGLAALLALGLAPILAAACSGRTIAGRVGAAAVLPILSLCLFLTVSRGGAIAFGTAVVAFFLLTPRRLVKLPTITLAAASSALLVVAGNQRDAMQAGLRSADAIHEGHELLAVAIAVCLGAGLVQLGLSLIERHVERPAWATFDRRAASRIAAVAALVVVVAGLAFNAPGRLSDQWTNFKHAQPSRSVDQTTSISRLRSITGNGRYQYWQSAVRAADSRPLAGRGAGTFELWWSRDGVLVGGFVRDAHSLYMQSLAELGIPGLLLIAAFLLFVLASGVRTSLARGTHESRVWVAAATAGCLAFCVSASVEWVWQMPVIPVAFMILAAGALGSARSRSLRPTLGRPVILVLAVLALPLLAVSVSSASSLGESQSSARSGSLSSALKEARTAARVQPYAATPRLQEAVLLEEAGDLDGAAIAARQATDREPTNWQPWLIRARLAAKLDHPQQALAYYERARELNPRSPLFRR
jgi:hypothetical protein